MKSLDCVQIRQPPGLDALRGLLHSWQLLFMPLVELYSPRPWVFKNFSLKEILLFFRARLWIKNFRPYECIQSSLTICFYAITSNSTTQFCFLLTRNALCLDYLVSFQSNLQFSFSVSGFSQINYLQMSNRKISGSISSILFIRTFEFQLNLYWKICMK